MKLNSVMYMCMYVYVILFSKFEKCIRCIQNVYNIKLFSYKSQEIIAVEYKLDILKTNNDIIKLFIICIMKHKSTRVVLIHL